GCAFSIVDEPEVLYRVWPTAETPAMWASSRASESESVPMLRTARAEPVSSIETTPTDSWPRCWSEYSPSCARCVASACPWTPKMPHILYEQSQMIRRECRRQELGHGTCAAAPAMILGMASWYA